MPKKTKPKETEVDFKKIERFADSVHNIFLEAEKTLSNAEMAELLAYISAQALTNFLVSVNNYSIDVTPVGPDLLKRQDEVTGEVLKNFEMLAAKNIAEAVPIGLYPMFLNIDQLDILNQVTSKVPILPANKTLN